MSASNAEDSDGSTNSDRIFSVESLAATGNQSNAATGNQSDAAKAAKIKLKLHKKFLVHKSRYEKKLKLIHKAGDCCDCNYGYLCMSYEQDSLDEFVTGNPDNFFYMRPKEYIEIDAEHLKHLNRNFLYKDKEDNAIWDAYVWEDGDLDLTDEQLDLKMYGEDAGLTVAQYFHAVNRIIYSKLKDRGLDYAELPKLLGTLYHVGTIRCKYPQWDKWLRGYDQLADDYHELGDRVQNDEVREEHIRFTVMLNEYGITFDKWITCCLSAFRTHGLYFPLHNPRRIIECALGISEESQIVVTKYMIFRG